MIKHIRKTIDRIFLLRVSGKGDAKGSANQVEVLKQYPDIPDVVTFLAEFDPRMMKASSQTGARLRDKWKRKYGLTELNRAGRRDFLGISVVIGRTRFIVYAATAAYMDEVTGNAFTRHVCHAIGDRAFHGLGDPEFMAARDAGDFESGEHPSLVYAFDPTRFVRSMASAILLYDAAARNLAAFEAKDLHIDPAQGDHMRLMWTFIAYGSEVEATVGKQRRFVGRLNHARAGHWPYRDGMVPLGGRRVAVPDLEDTYALGVDEQHTTSVEALAGVGLRADATNAEVLRVLAGRGVTSGDPKTLGVPVDQLDPAAAKRFYLRRKLEAYRDGVARAALRRGDGEQLPARLRPYPHPALGGPQRRRGTGPARVDQLPRPVPQARRHRPSRQPARGVDRRRHRRRGTRTVEPADRTTRSRRRRQAADRGDRRRPTRRAPGRRHPAPRAGARPHAAVRPRRPAG